MAKSTLQRFIVAQRNEATPVGGAVAPGMPGMTAPAQAVAGDPPRVACTITLMPVDESGKHMPASPVITIPVESLAHAPKLGATLALIEQ